MVASAGEWNGLVEAEPTCRRSQLPARIPTSLAANESKWTVSGSHHFGSSILNNAASSIIATPSSRARMILAPGSVPATT